jgi:cardiolipin synthase
MKPKKFTGTYGIFRMWAVGILAFGNIAVTITIFMLLATLSEYIGWAFSMLAIIIILRMTVRLRAPDHTLAWAIIMMLLPILGVVLYFTWGKVCFTRNEKGFLERSMNNGWAFLHTEKDKFNELKRWDSKLARQAAVLNRVGFPVYRGGTAEYFSSGEMMFKRMLEDLETAQRHIFIDYYIIADGELWREIYGIIARKANEGVEVRVLCDDFGCVKSLEKRFIKDLRDNGIKIAIFNPIHRYLQQLYAIYRSHQKMCVIDSKIGYVGGANIADEYINKKSRFGHWKDTGIRFTGGCVRSITVEFLQMWDVVTENVEKNLASFMPKETDESGGGYFLPFADGPYNNPLNPAHDIYMTMCGTAQESIWFTTPYLTPDCPLRETLIVAAHGGIDVRIVTPGIPDYKSVYAATRGHYQQLLNAGVRIYEYTPGLMHAKMALCDKKSAVIGSINMDSRSFYHQYENAVWFTGTGAVDDMTADFEHIFTQCREINAQEWKKRPLLQRFVEATMCLMSPMF